MDLSPRSRHFLVQRLEKRATNSENRCSIPPPSLAAGLVSPSESDQLTSLSPGARERPTPAARTAAGAPKKTGLAFWMQSVLEECDRVQSDFAPDPVHDLRVALRRCRSIADGLRAIDPDPAWKQMKKAGKLLFGDLGALRDVQVMAEWVHLLDSPGDPVTTRLLQFLATQETQLKQEAAVAVREFDRKQWNRWSKSLPRRAARLRPGGAVFQHLALERWTEAYELHHHALRNRSQFAFHRLRIGLKRFRYLVENFLPQQHAAWNTDLKELQDLLGEIHDLDILWATALQISAFHDEVEKSRWHGRIGEERTRRIRRYRDKMLGRASLWQAWRAELPKGPQIKAAALARLKMWAAFLDSDFKHSNHVARLALQLYDGLATNGRPAQLPSSEQRAVLRTAALLHDVGRSQSKKGQHKAAYRLIRALAPPLGWNEQDLRMAGVVARYHRGALPRLGQKALQGLSPDQRKSALRLAGILRLAEAFDEARDGRIQRLDVHNRNGVLVIAAQGYSPRHRLADAIASARHLLETVYRRPVLVKPLRVSKPKPAATARS